MNSLYATEEFSTLNTRFHYAKSALLDELISLIVSENPADAPVERYALDGGEVVR